MIELVSIIASAVVAIAAILHPLSPRDERKDKLLVKFKKEELTFQKAAELEVFLQQDLEKAKKERDIAPSMAIGLALGLLGAKKAEAKET